MSPIRRLQNSQRQVLPRLGKLRKGGQKGATGFGKDLTHFRFTAEGNNAEVDSAFRETYGEQPAMLRVYLPYAEPRRNFDAWQEAWGRGETLIHRCDGEVCVKWRGEDGQYVNDYDQVQAHPCPFIADRDNKAACKPVGRLQVVLPELWQAGYVGLVTIETHSVNDIAHIEAVLADAYERADAERGLRGIEFIVRRREERITRRGEQGPTKVSKWLVKIEPAAEWLLAQLDAARRDQLHGTEPEPETLPETNIDPDTGEVLDPPWEEEEVVEAEVVEVAEAVETPVIDEAAWKGRGKWVMGRLQDMDITLKEAKELCKVESLKVLGDPETAMNAVAVALAEATGVGDPEPVQEAML